MKLEFPRAEPSQAAALSVLAIESKGHWGYPKLLLELWRKNLRIESEYISSHFVRTVVANGETVGFFAIKRESDGSILDHLWLLPKVIGKGIGGLAFRKIEEDCRTLGIREFNIVSDPNAEGFYLRQGAKRVGEVESIPQNRMLPKLTYTLDATPS